MIYTVAYGMNSNSAERSSQKVDYLFILKRRVELGGLSSAGLSWVGVAIE